MRLFNTNHHLLILQLCLLAIVSPIAAVPPQEIAAEPCQTYAIVCFISFCLGTLLCGLIHKYCTPQPIIPPKKQPAEEFISQQDFLKKLLALKNQQE